MRGEGRTRSSIDALARAEQSTGMTRDELRKTIASKPNKLAGKAIAAIKSGEPLEALAGIVDQGASDKHYYRDPLHPRSKYRVDHVLDSCFGQGFGVVKEGVRKGPGGSTVSEATLGHIPASGGRGAHFAYLLDKGFTPGSNGYRGSLFQAIIKCCFYRDPDEAAVATDLAKILVAKGKVDIQRFAETNYEWTGSLDKLDKLVSLGAKPSPGMLDCALQYCICAPSAGDPESGRADVIRSLLDSGAKPTKPIGRLGSAAEQLEFLSRHGLSGRIGTARTSLVIPTGSTARVAVPPGGRGGI